MNFFEVEEDLEDYGIGIREENKTLLHPVEYIYAKEKGLIKEKTDQNKIDKIKEENLEIYSVYKFLMDRGYICRLSLNDNKWIRVGRKGFRKGEERTKYIVKPIKEIDLKTLESDVEFSIKIRKKLVYAIVGEKIEFISVESKIFV